MANYVLVLAVGIAAAAPPLKSFDQRLPLGC
jgi:hypothetical protein